MKRILVLTFIIGQTIMSCKKDDLSSDCESRYFEYAKPEFFGNYKTY